MKAKNKLHILAISSMLFLGFALSPASAYAERHGGNSERGYSSSKSKHKKHGHYKGNKRLGQHRRSSHNSRPVYSRPRHVVRHRPVVSYYYEPRGRYYRSWNAPLFSINFENEHFGFTYRD